MVLYLVEQHIPTADPVTGTSVGQPFTGSDIRHVVYVDSCQERAEQFADVANLTCIYPWVRGYKVRPTVVEVG